MDRDRSDLNALILGACFAVFVSCESTTDMDQGVDRGHETALGLDRFTLQYSLAVPGDRKRILRLSYERPHRACLELREGARITKIWVVDEAWVALITSGDEVIRWSHVDTEALLKECSDVHEVLRERFGYPARTGRLFPEFHLDPENRSLGISLTGVGEEAPFLCWTGVHRELYETAEHEGSFTVLHGPHRTTLRIDRGEYPGVLVEASSPEMQLRLELVEQEVEQGVFELPTPPHQPGPEHDEMERSIRAQYGPWGTRKVVVERLANSLRRGELEWTDKTMTDARAVFEQLHRHWLPSHYETWISGRRDYVLWTAEWVSRQRERGVSAEELRAVVAKKREELDSTLRDQWSAYEKNLRSQAEPGTPHSLLELEISTAQSLYDRVVSDILLGVFASEVEDQLGR